MDKATLIFWGVLALIGVVLVVLGIKNLVRSNQRSTEESNYLRQKVVKLDQNVNGLEHEISRREWEKKKKTKKLRERILWFLKRRY